jgi:hypothetical protein
MAQSASDRLHDPPPGWTAASGLLEPDPTVAGHLARMQELKGVCSRRDCRRRCHVDLERLAARGFGAIAVSAVQGLLRCHSLTGCGLEFHADPRTGLPLRALAGRSHVRIRIKCGACGFFRVILPETLIARLSAEAPMPDGLYISDIAGRIRGPCRQCRKTAWRVEVLWPDARSEGARRRTGGAPP